MLLKKKKEKRLYTAQQLERIIKGFANYRRLEVLFVLEQRPGLTIENIAELLHTGYMNASDHMRKLVAAGLVHKYHQGPTIFYNVSPRGESVLAFCKNLK